MPPDFTIADHGSLWLLFPQTDAAKAWAREHIDPNALAFGKSVVIEPRYVEDIVTGIVNDGLTITH